MRRRRRWQRNSITKSPTMRDIDWGAMVILVAIVAAAGSAVAASLIWLAVS